MKIIKVLNNNALIALNSSGDEKILLGKGIGFGQKVGNVIEKTSASQIFSLDRSDQIKKYEDVLDEIDIEYLEISEEIYSYAQQRLSKQLNELLVIFLADHISYTSQRLKDGYIIPQSGLLYDVKLLYKDEYEISLEAIDIISQKLGTKLPTEEAAYIAVHIINAELDGTDVGQVVKITEFIEEILNILKYSLDYDYDTESVDFYRFITHLKFFAIRVFNINQEKKVEVLELLDIFKYKYPFILEVVERIAIFIEKKYKYSINEEEKLYLMIHIKRLIDN